MHRGDFTMHQCIVQTGNSPFQIPPGCPHCKRVYTEKNGILGMELPEDQKIRRNPPPCPFIGKANMIISFSSRQIYFPCQKGVFSLKTAFGGEEVYEVEKKRFIVGEKEYLIMNSDINYSSFIDSKTDVESFCVFFGKSFMEEVSRNLTLPQAKLLEDPTSSSPVSIHFREEVGKGNPVITPSVHNLRRYIKETKDLEQSRLDETFYNLLENIFISHPPSRINPTIELPFPPALREEAKKRLLTARDFMDAHFNQDMNLSAISGQAGLSPYHFLRLFKSAFGTTPRQYIIQKRLEKAKTLLQKNRQSLAEITLDIGFESQSYFSRLFRKSFGMSPREFQQNNKKG